MRPIKPTACRGISRHCWEFQGQTLLEAAPGHGLALFEAEDLAGRQTRRNLVAEAQPRREVQSTTNRRKTAARLENCTAWRS